MWAKIGNEQRYYLYEGDTLVAELDAQGEIAAEYVWGLLGPIARVPLSGGIQFYILDGLGHVRALLGRTQSGWQITDSYAYDSWGNLIGRTGNTNQPFTWNGAYGYEYVPATGLYHVGARAYDPRTGRWLQRDPIDAASGDPNLYLYCVNDPLNLTDPEGEQWLGRLLKAIWEGLRRLRASRPKPQPAKAREITRKEVSQRAPAKSNPTPRDVSRQKQQPGAKNKSVSQARQERDPKGGWKKLAKCSLAKPDCGETHGHHVFPREFRHIFENAGIDIDAYIVELPAETHRQLHKDWNKRWEEFLKSKPNKEAMIQFAKDLLKEKGLEDAIPCVFGKP